MTTSTQLRPRIELLRNLVGVLLQVRAQRHIAGSEAHDAVVALL